MDHARMLRRVVLQALPVRPIRNANQAPALTEFAATMHVAVSAKRARQRKRAADLMEYAVRLL